MPVGILWTAPTNSPFHREERNDCHPLGNRQPRRNLRGGDEGAGLVGLGVATPSGVQQRAVSTAGHPDLLQARAAKQALNFLRLTLLNGA